MATTTSSTDPAARGTDSTSRSGLPPLLGVQAVVALLLGGVFWLGGAGEPKAQPRAPHRIDSEAISQVASLLAADREALEAELTAPLMAQDEQSVGEFADLQVQAADLELVDMSWRSLTAVDDLVPVELTLRATGSYYNLPILVDGLYRQAHPMEITYLAVETPRMMVAHTEATVRMRFHRPATLSTSSLKDRLESVLGGLRSRAAEVAIEEAARVQLLQEFQKKVPGLEERSSTNRSQVMTALPGMLRKLPSTALGWVGMEQTGDAMSLIVDPG